jgi:molecular chaperone DnaK
MGPIIGIELGTTNSVAAYMKDGRPVIIPNLEGEALTPSVVAFARDAHSWVGRIAKAQAVANPLRTVFSVKRHIGRGGRREGDSATVISSIKRQMGSEFALEVDGRSYGPVEISAMILEKMKSDAEAFLGESVERAVVTVPAYFNDGQRRATKDAASLAGLEVVRLVNEPTAAALAYGLDMEQAHTILVWDLGGGTFDVSVLELGDGVFEVKAVNGNTQLGGDDYDQRLVELLTESFGQQWRIHFDDDPAARQLLRQLAEAAKMKLSTDEETTVVLPHAFGRGGRCAVTITRDAFEQATADITERMAAPAQRALSDAGIDPLDLDRVVLVGGMTRVPAVRRLARQITGLDPYGHIDPDQVVALGAAVQAGVLAGEVRKVTLVDVTPLSLGIETQGGLFARVILRNTPVPTTKSRLFTNARDDQTALEIHVLQGERELAADNMPLGMFELTGITPQPRGEAKVEVAFDIDANGMIHVLACDLQTETTNRVRVEAAGAPSRELVESMLAQSQERMESDRHKRAEIEAAIRAQNLIQAAEVLSDEAAQATPGEGIDQAVQAAESAATAVREALAAGETEAIAASANDLEASLKKLSKVVKALQAAASKDMGETPMGRTGKMPVPREAAGGAPALRGYAA